MFICYSECQNELITVLKLHHTSGTDMYDLEKDYNRKTNLIICGMTTLLFIVRNIVIIIKSKQTSTLLQAFPPLQLDDAS
jgi:hypothetical protein